MTTEEILSEIVGAIIMGGFGLLTGVILFWGLRHIFNGKNWDRGD